MISQIKKIFKSDQEDRKKLKNGEMVWVEVIKNDSLRREKILEVIKKNKNKLSESDCFYAAIPFHHSHNVAHLKIALKLAKESVIRGHKRGKKLMMAIEDRLCLAKGISQKHGTQSLIRNGKLVKCKKE
ncbi:MAG: hypothetical protein A3H01_00530 [Candidatus Wildermuthbacteria bacterium RIFCSPLOWO2_12_FULL_40_9]|uniref:Uncharacterized protein n=2 Tax=Candidatus Wildermuthiibacteriota TaxID=1817923 RepID=A0A1G2RCJ0_9BACT|nr:MAG: hypothetical protein A3F15_00465 [Candidatus Wildermuthbacteria bacterium RIFCSPHIGHO2_12_FULL_40_12]OHA77260.1 MAG: hypothetical protein A3H01_00530 [Candidatus Wildermuthbacteria bacterium RIFCSPLOWO2_12_FULL_40_9]